jgi:anti-anti-sigma regulatory factor
MSERVYQQDGLVFAVQQEAGTATVSWKGVSDSRFPGQFLNPLIQDCVEQLRDCEVTVDLSQLEYMNSATVMPLINLVKRLDGNGKPVRVLFLDVEWQRTHGNCMSAIARTLKNVRIEHQAFVDPGSTSSTDLPIGSDSESTQSERS